MRLTASDFMTYWRPSLCELRVFLHEKGEPEAEPGPFDEVMRRLGIRHEQEHLATLGPYLDLSTVLLDERVGKTLEAIASKTPVKTVESYWPYATTLFDYVKRAMPFNAPGSLSDDETYAVVAYILGEANIIGKNEIVSASTLPQIQMPNRNGFVSPDPRPDVP